MYSCIEFNIKRVITINFIYMSIKLLLFNFLDFSLYNSCIPFYVPLHEVNVIMTERLKCNKVFASSIIRVKTTINGFWVLLLIK